MRFLCLHGKGSNSEIFSTQTVALRHEIGSAHAYEFLEGVVPVPTAEELRAYYPSSVQTFTYFDEADVQSMQQALEQLHMFIQLEGPFDGVIGFSSGAAFAASYLAQRAWVNPPEEAFKCAIFFSAARPVDPAKLAEGELRLFDATNGVQIQIPTVHVWGSNDVLHPESHNYVRQLSAPGPREDVVHEEGHAIPGGKARASVLEVAKAVRRMTARVEELNGR